MLRRSPMRFSSSASTASSVDEVLCNVPFRDRLHDDVELGYGHSHKRRHSGSFRFRSPTLIKARAINPTALRITDQKRARDSHTTVLGLKVVPSPPMTDAVRGFGASLMAAAG